MSQQHKTLITKITEVLEADSRVLAAWLEGSVARREEDDYSDLDLWITVKDNAFDEFVEEREKFASKLGSVLSILYPKTLDQDETLDSFQILLEDQATSLTIDVDIQPKSRNFKFTKDSAAEECEVLFDKGDVVRYKPFNPQHVEEYVEELFEDTVTRFWHLLTKVSVHLKRQDLLEAIHDYTDRVEDLVTIYRIMYTPEKADWGFKDIEYDLPEDAVKVIYNLMPQVGVKSMEKSLRKLSKAFSKQSKAVGKRLGVDLPKELINHVEEEL